MRVLVVTDAWRPQINGVVRSLEHMADQAPSFGVEMTFLTPERFRSFPMPTYPEIRLSLTRPDTVERMIAEATPDHVHIATEGPLGLTARLACRRQGRVFTTSYHTRFPEYLSARLPVPEEWSYRALRWFHREARVMMVSTPSLERELSARGFRNIVRWTRGVDTTLFRPRHERVVDFPGPIFLYVGRIAVEKNLEAFLSLDLPGTKVVVGDGPARQELERQHVGVRFLGSLAGEDLARVYSSADVFVFPSLTDTFGIVLLEALASGLPIAGFPVTGPVDVINSSGCGVVDEDLRKAALAALDVPRDLCRAYGETFTWRESARQFFSNIQAAHTGA
ncbi:glycosyltransferase family 4 protein [Microvirga guangxiensis]|uniref:Glycosyltransferase involved in cell wall bisynthesis n=1 Tax=Microvirga guangxiensis TaxID=549386 RepID=A0A1G5ICC6_9HYPH|nr:glycosyltransferase family 1 protein [Microvirga guangxiensis]SCY73607.1 Glycosyltransferase involved in cell wall bisynthesis [Microvirga guangxiensis]